MRYEHKTAHMHISITNIMYLHEKLTASGTIAKLTASPAVIAVKYFGFVKSSFVPNRLLALATILSSCDGGVDSSVDVDDKRRDIPRKGVPDIGTDLPCFPFAVVDVVEVDVCELLTSHRLAFLFGLAFGMGSKHLELGRIATVRITERSIRNISSDIILDCKRIGDREIDQCLKLIATSIPPKGYPYDSLRFSW